MKTKLLCELRPGEAGRVQALDLYGGMRRRLRDLGFQPGGLLRCAFVAPAGSPMAFWCQDALIALRREDCRRIRVLPCG